MPKLPLPPNAPICGGELPVTDASDIAAAEADAVKATPVAPIRDAMREAVAAMMLRYQRLAETTAAQGSRRRATRNYLKGIAGEHGFVQQPNESQAAFRARSLLPQDPVTPEAIVATANAVLAPFTTISCRYFESVLDRGFIFSTPAGVSSPMSFVGTSAGAVSPQAPDRYYPDDAAQNGGFYLPHRDPGSFWVFSDAYGRMLVLRVPYLAGMEEVNNFIGNGASLDPDGSFWVQNGGAAPTVQSYITAGGAAIEVYQAIANAVDRLVGHSIRWVLYVDPNLTA